VFGECVKKAGLAERFLVESCGTGGGNPNWYQEGGWSYHEGESSDPRMKQAASERGITITSTSRPLNEGDFGRFEYIVGMDESNLTAIRTAANAWGIPREGEGSYKVLNMADYCREHNVSKVPGESRSARVPFLGFRQAYDSRSRSRAQILTTPVALTRSSTCSRTPAKVYWTRSKASTVYRNK